MSEINENLHRIKARGLSPKRDLHTGSIYPRANAHGFLESFDKTRQVNFQTNENGSILIPRIIPKTEDNSQEEKPIHKEHQQANHKKKLWFKILLGVVLTLVVIFIITGILAYDLYKKGLALNTSIQELKDSAKAQDLQIVKDGVPKVHESLVAFDKSYKRMGFASIVPYFGTFYVDGTHALKVAGHSIDAALTLIETIEPYADIIGFSPNSNNAVSADQNAQQRIDFIIKTIPDLIPTK
jgi:hypothetical protein